MLVRPLWILCGLWIVSINAQVAVDDGVMDLDDQPMETVDDVGGRREESIIQPDSSSKLASDSDDPSTLKEEEEKVDMNESILDESIAASPDTDNDARSNDETSPTSKDVDTKHGDVSSALDDANYQELEGLTNDELEAVCLERGFEIQKADGSSLTREDLLEAAARCLKLEEEMNSVLEENPELALELETEIERMKEEKERLEAEQAAMLEEKSTLEEQLREAGVDPGPIEPKSSNGMSLSATSTDTPESLEEVLRTSFTMLFERVGNDIMLVGKLMGYVAKPAGGTVALAWRYTEPTIEGLVQKGFLFVEGVLSTAPVETFRSVIQSQLVPIKNVLWPIVQTTTRQAVSVAKLGFVKLDTIEPAHKTFVILGAIFGPLRDSLTIGWQNTLRPNLSMARRKTGAWVKRLQDDIKAKAEA